MTNLMQLSTALSATVQTTRELDGLVAIFGSAAKSQGQFRNQFIGIESRLRSDDRSARHVNQSH